jgi:hypothetical protein
VTQCHGAPVADAMLTFVCVDLTQKAYQRELPIERLRELALNTFRCSRLSEEW